MARFRKTESLRAFQQMVGDIYGLPDDRLYSIFDHLSQIQRFTMRALKGIRKENMKKLETNLLIAFAWLMAFGNRMHIDIEDEVWARFPARCSYCGKAPCVCKTMKPDKRLRIRPDITRRPGSLAGFQEMFRAIYPSESRSLADAGVHLAEETGEVSEAVHNFLGQHKEGLFDEVRLEIADYVSCIFGVANSAHIDVAASLGAMFNRGCHVCHNAPCICKFEEVAALKT